LDLGTQANRGIFDRYFFRYWQGCASAAGNEPDCALFDQVLTVKEGGW
jgi:hypothetical protein